MKFTKPVLPTSHPPRVPRTRNLDPDQAQLQRQVRVLTSEVIGLQEQLLAVHRSTSWRITAPLRWFSSRLQGKATPSPVAVKRAETYAEWVRLYDSAAAGTQDAFSAGVLAHAARPMLSVVVRAQAEQLPLLRASIDSMIGQTYDRWELILAAERPRHAELEQLLPEGESARARIKLSPGGLSTQAARELAAGDWVILLEPGNVLPPFALCHLASEIHGHAEARIIYADEDLLDIQGRRIAPMFKPDWNPDVFYSQNMVAHLAVFEKGLLGQVGGLRDDHPEAAVYELVLSCMERVRPAQIRRIARILCHRSAAGGAMPSANVLAAESRVLGAHFERSGTAARILQVGHVRRVQYALPADPPLVTLIVPTRNGLALLRQCVESIVATTTYPNYELLLIDNGSDEPDALAYLAELHGQPGITVIRDDRPFNYSALNNMAVRHARGDIVGLVNNDIEVISPGWLDEMVSLALQPGVGAVGAKLLYPDDTIQHGGVLLGVGGAIGVAGHANKFLPSGQAGYMDRAQAIQSFSAVTAACLVVRKPLYEQVGGLNEVELKIAYNDVDFCLRLREAGYRNVWTPYAELFHHESATRGSDFSPEKRQRFDQEQDYMRARWGQLIADDPAYNPNLTVYAEDFGLAWPPRVPWITGAAAP